MKSSYPALAFKYPPKFCVCSTAFERLQGHSLSDLLER